MSPFVSLALALALGSARAAEPDLDGDGFTASFDCDDTDAAVNPGARETCDGIDDDCDGLVDDDDTRVSGVRWYYEDLDGDGVGGGGAAGTYCVPPSGYVRISGDCDDTDASIGSVQVSHPDDDGDGYGWDLSTTVSCTVPTGNVLLAGDCDDRDAAINPGTPEVCNDIDDNCDRLVDEHDPALVASVFYDDADRDGYGDDATADSTGCAQPHGYVAIGGDCAPDDVATHPSAPEICDGEDNDCDGATDESTVAVEWYRDVDGDGYGLPTDVRRACVPPPGYARGRGDCDDRSADVSPLDDEVCGNGLDDDCDGAKDNCTVVADDVADFVIESSEDYASFGESLAVGDVDADGVADLVVSAPYGGFTGMVSTFSGPASGSATTGSSDRSFTGASYDDGFGTAVSYADANGDGIDDLLVGAPYGAFPHAYLFLGPTTAGAALTSADADAVLWNDGYSTALGTAVLITGDHDGDGISDLAVGTPGEDLKDGGVAVIAGDTEGDHNLRDDALYAYRSGKHDRCGHALAAFDENGDGLDDLLFGAPTGSSASLVDAGSPPGTYNVAAVADAAFVGDWPGDSFGWDVAASDLDGDGYGDALIGAPDALGTGALGAGAVYAFLGPLSGTTESAVADVRWIGDADGTYRFGWAVAAGGDVDGDGEPDTVIGDWYAHGTEAGTVYLQLGIAHGVITTDRLTALDTSGRNALGYDVAFLPDWDGDGRPEIVAGAPATSNDAGVPSGGVSVFFSDSLFE